MFINQLLLYELVHSSTLGLWWLPRFDLVILLPNTIPPFLAWKQKHACRKTLWPPQSIKEKNGKANFILKLTLFFNLSGQHRVFHAWTLSALWGPLKPPQIQRCWVSKMSSHSVIYDWSIVRLGLVPLLLFHPICVHSATWYPVLQLKRVKQLPEDW